MNKQYHWNYSFNKNILKLEMCIDKSANTHINMTKPKKQLDAHFDITFFSSRFDMQFFLN